MPVGAVHEKSCLMFNVLLLQGKLEERKPFMLLFDDVAINYILCAAQ